MSYSTDSYTQEDTFTFPVYQRLRKINPYAYYSLDAQKQMQQDLREAGSLVFFEQDEDTLPEPDGAAGLISLPVALSEAAISNALRACSAVPAGTVPIT